MKRVIVIGSPGAGKSTFSRNLRDQTGLPLYHLDKIWHQPDRTTISREEFDERLIAILAKDSWIIDGNYSRTLGVLRDLWGSLSTGVDKLPQRSLFPPNAL